MQKKKITLFICLLLTLTLTAISLAACMDSTLLEDNVKERLLGEGYTVKYVQNAKAVDGYQTVANNGEPTARILSILYCFREQLNDDGSVAKTEEGKSIMELEGWVFYCANEAAADWAEASANDYKSVDEKTGRIVYRHSNIVVYGDYTAVSAIRDY